MIGSSDIHFVLLLIVFKIVDHTSVWIVGNSIIRNASEHAIVNYGNHHLNLKPHNISLRWFGKGGMIWEDLEPFLHNMVSKFGQPGVIVVHCGGNSIASMSLRRLQKFMKLTIANMQAHFPTCKIIWSQILPRNYYRHSYSHIAAKRALKRINSSLSAFIMSRGRGYIHYPDLGCCSPKLYRDGNHLSDIGQFIFLNAMQAGLYKILTQNISCYSTR